MFRVAESILPPAFGGYLYWKMSVRKKSIHLFCFRLILTKYKKYKCAVKWERCKSKGILRHWWSCIQNEIRPSLVPTLRWKKETSFSFLKNIFFAEDTFVSINGFIYMKDHKIDGGQSYHNYCLHMLSPVQHTLLP